MVLASPKKVVHVIGALVANGAEAFVVSLLECMRETGRNVGLWVLSSRTDAVGIGMAARLEHAGIQVEMGPSRRVNGSTVLWYLRRLLAERPSAVHLHTPNTELTHYLAKWSTGYRPLLFRTIHNTNVPRARFLRMAYLGNAASCSVACGEAAKASYVSLLRGNVVHISNGVRFDFPIRSHASAARARHALNLDRDAYHFVHVGRMSGRDRQSAPKAHDTLIRAWQRSSLGSENCQLHLVGDGNLRGELESLAGRDPSIHFKGIRQDVSTWLLGTDCFVMPSRSEGLPIAAIEAIGAGLPCVLSDIAALRELDAPAALCCRVDDVDCFAAGMKAMAQQRPSPDTERVERFRERYSIRHAATEYQRIYASNGL